MPEHGYSLSEEQWKSIRHKEWFCRECKRGMRESKTLIQLSVNNIVLRKMELGEEAQWEKDIENNLSGLDGIVYIMFVGAERYASQLHAFIQNKEKMDQSIERLTSHGDKFLRKMREEHIGGIPAKIYTANLEPLKKTYEIVFARADTTSSRIKSFLGYYLASSLIISLVSFP